MVSKDRIFIDESCHLENDHQPVMGIGYVKVPAEAYQELRAEIIRIKKKHYSPVELKWGKLSKSRIPFYDELIDFFFASPLEFRGVVVRDKQDLDHDQFNLGSHDNFYYKVIYYLLRPNIEKGACEVFLDIKDTRGRTKLRKIDEVFHSASFGNSPFCHFQHIRSHDNEFIQLADFFIGALVYKAKNEDQKPEASEAKKYVLEELTRESGYDLDKSTPPWEDKFNIFYFQPKNNG
jgi:hypothetical protein